MPASPPTPQLPLALRYPPDQRLETFAGHHALGSQLRGFATGAGGDGMLLLVGPPGSGKTHLALAACALAEAAGRRAAYLPLASAAGRLREALDALEGYDLLALDGLDAVAGMRADELALFDAHNRARAAGTQLLYAARVAPEGLPPGLPDLRSRLGQCTRITLQPLGEEDRREVLRQRARRRGWEFDEAALDWLLRRVDRDLAGLAALLDRLDRASLAAKRRITVPFLRELFSA